MRISDWSSDVCSSDLSGLRMKLPDTNRRLARWSKNTSSGTRPGTATTRHPVARISRSDNSSKSGIPGLRSEEHTSELQSLMRISYAVFCLKKKIKTNNNKNTQH